MAFRRDIATFSESTILSATIAFYRLGDVLYAPNDELVEMLQQRTQKPVFLMKRGIDTQLFSPRGAPPLTAFCAWDTWAA